MSVFHFVGRHLGRLGALIILLIAALGCEHGTPRGSSATIDDFGDSVRLDRVPTRIVSLSPASTEILFALGAGRRLVGRTRWDTFPESALAVPDLGDGIRPNVEAILTARPDLVVIYASDENREAARALRAARIPVVALRLDRIADFARTTRLLGTLVGGDSRAQRVVDTVSRTLAKVAETTRSLDHPTAFLPAYQQPLLAIGAGSFLSELVEVAGGRNVFGDLTAPSPQVSFEEVLRRNPDVVMLSPSAAAELRAQARWRQLPAVRQGRVLIMDTLLIARPGPRLGEAATSLARLLHPGVVR
jgi:iron complex transport system substrate-binding protein